MRGKTRMFQTILNPIDVFESQPFLLNHKQIHKKLENSVVYGVKCNEGLKIQQLFSTNPEDYLNPQYSPGNILKI